MADYPSVTQVIPSSELFDEGTVVERARSGKPRFHTFYSKAWGEFVIIHECYEADKDSIIAHYAGDKFNEFNFVWAGDGDTYAVRYAARPVCTPIEGNLRWKVVSRLMVSS